MPVAYRIVLEQARCIYFENKKNNTMSRYLTYPHNCGTLYPMKIIEQRITTFEKRVKRIYYKN